MDRNHLELCVELNNSVQIQAPSSSFVSLETEIPEALYLEMKEFLVSNPSWDQYRMLRSALANFLFQNGHEDRAVTECYLNDLFTCCEA